MEGDRGTRRQLGRLRERHLSFQITPKLPKVGQQLGKSQTSGNCSDMDEVHSSFRLA